MSDIIVPMQEESFKTWSKKHRVFDKDGNAIDGSIEEAQVRVARALAGVEKKDRAAWEKKFVWAMQNGAVPAGRIFSNAGAQAHKNKVSLINCLGGDTPVLTKDGIKKIKHLARKGKPVYVLNGAGRWSKVMFKSYGVQETVGLKFQGLNRRKEETVRATMGHRWILDDGKVITTEYWLTGKTNSRHIRVPNICAPKGDVQSDDFAEGLLHGLIYGDGTYTPHNRKHGHLKFQLDLVGDKAESFANFVASYTGIEPKHYSYSQGVTRFTNIEMSINAKELPINESKDYLTGFFAGLLGTDGHITETAGDNRRKSSYIYIYGKKELIEFLVNVLPTIGIITISHGVHGGGGLDQDTNYGKRNSEVWSVTINPSTVSTKIVLRKKQRKALYVGEDCIKFAQYWTYLGNDGEFRNEEVFCCEEPETQSFVLFNGLLTGNCVVSDTIHDSMDSILAKLHEAGMSLKAGCGIGYEFSTLRFNGAFVQGAGATTSGPLSFMDIYDKMCRTVSSAGGRRGAQMATFDIKHPDIFEYIEAKRHNGVLENFNLSVLITDEFMEAVQSDDEWALEWNGEVIRTVQARDLMDKIMMSTYNYAEPGFILVDRINKYNNLWFCEMLRATNPCGEQPLPPYGSCLLGSINLALFVRNAFTPQAFFDFDKFREVISVFARMLDNVVEISELPLEGQHREIISKRRHGMGYMGLGSALAMMCIPYGSEAGVDFTRKVTQVLAYMNYTAGYELAREKGEAPILQQMHNVSDIPHNFNTNFKGKSASYKGRTLFLESHYFDNFEGDDEGALIMGKIKKYGCRFSHATSIAPTGTIAFGLGNNVSNGIEPSFMNYYLRNRIEPGKATKEQVAVYSFEMLAYKEYVRAGLVKHEGEVTDKNLPSYFSTSETVSVRGHIDTQAAAQEWVDSSISKTVNVPRDISFNDFKEVYTYAWFKGLKGCATYRPNPERFSGVLVRPEEQASTVYEFVTETGDVISARGDEKILYRGEEHIAANLAEAIRNGYFGKN